MRSIETRRVSDAHFGHVSRVQPGKTASPTGKPTKALVCEVLDRRQTAQVSQT